MATITQTIRHYLEPYYDNDFCLSDKNHIKTIENNIFKACGLDYAINQYQDTSYADEIIYYVFSWVEDGKLQTFDLLIENYSEYYGDEDMEDLK